LSKNSDDYFLIVSALVPYKRIDLAVHTFNQIDEKLIIIGDGPELKKLRREANANIQFLNWLPHSDLLNHYAGCKALIFPGEEDFGIVPVEAQACGKPVIAYARGGALETVIGHSEESKSEATGVFFTELNPAALRDAIEQFKRITWDPEFIFNHAQKFSRDNFKSKIKDFIDEKSRDFFRQEKP
jgi:glycosyltransferase involved in cell wall biosynthesis